MIVVLRWWERIGYRITARPSRLFIFISAAYAYTWIHTGHVHDCETVGCMPAYRGAVGSSCWCLQRSSSPAWKAEEAHRSCVALWLMESSPIGRNKRAAGYRVSETSPRDSNTEAAATQPSPHTAS